VQAYNIAWPVSSSIQVKSAWLIFLYKWGLIISSLGGVFWWVPSLFRAHGKAGASSLFFNTILPYAMIIRISQQVSDLKCVWQCYCGCFSNNFLCQNTCKWFFLFFKNYFWHLHIKTIQNIQIIFNFSKKNLIFLKTQPQPRSKHAVNMSKTSIKTNE
jgi:hypothetical protein